MKTQIDLLTKHLLAVGVEKVNIVDSLVKEIKSDSIKEMNYLNNQKVVFKPMSKETKVEAIKWTTTMIKMVIRIIIKEIGKVRMTEVGCMYR